MSLVATKRSFTEWWALVKKAALAWVDDYAPSMGAALSYYTVFSLAPMLLIVLAVAGLVFGEDAARGALFEQIAGLMGPDAAKAIEGILTSVSKPTHGIVATVVGIVVLLVGATTVFAELQDALDRIWRAPARKASGLWGLLRARFLSFGMILGIAFLLMVSLVVGAAVSALGKWWSPLFGGWEFLAQAVNFVFGLAVSTVAFALIYKLMPRVKVEWHDVWLGAAVTALLFSLGRFLIGLYIGKSGIASGFGAAGSLITVFVWVYYSAQIFLMGAEFTWVYAKTFGSMKDVPQTATAEKSEVPARETQPELAPARQAIAVRPKPSAWADIAIALSVGLLMRYVGPALARRAAKGHWVRAPRRAASQRG